MPAPTPPTDDDKKYKFLSLWYGGKRRQMKKLTSAPTMTTRVPTPDHSFAVTSKGYLV